MTPSEAFEVTGLLAAAFPTPAWSAETIRLWCEMLEDLEVEAARKAAMDWIRSSDERPTIAGIRREVAKLAAGAQGAGYLSPDEAWGYVEHCFSTVGRYREFPSEHPLVKHAVDLLGWRHLCESENVDVIRGQFRHAYTALLERGVSAAAASTGAAQLPELILPGRAPLERIEDGRRVAPAIEGTRP